jgi:L-asparaginase II
VLAASVRSGLEETAHQGTVAVVDGNGSLIAHHGELDRPFFIRSSAKPFQAFVSQQCGADLSVLELAMACSSHRGFPVHVSLVTSMLDSAGLDESALGCPPDWPAGAAAARLVQREGGTGPRRIWHNCSGKHAGFLRACVARGWPTETYLSPDHPLQRLVIETVSDFGEYRVEPVGVDGCGAPVLRTTARAMATMFARLAAAPELNEVFASMHRYPALVAANGEGDTTIAIAANAVAKGGAAGCVGVAVAGQMGLAAKSWDGVGAVSYLAAAETLRRLGVFSATGTEVVGPVINPPVLGGGGPVGWLEPRFELSMA